MLDNIVFEKELVRPTQTDSGEGPIKIAVTAEVNLTAVWLTSCVGGKKLIFTYETYNHKNKAIEAAVELSKGAFSDIAVVKSRIKN